VAYRIAALILIVLGLLAILSIGPLLLLVGLAMLVLGPVRGRPVVFWEGASAPTEPDPTCVRRKP